MLCSVPSGGLLSEHLVTIVSLSMLQSCRGAAPASVCVPVKLPSRRGSPRLLTGAAARRELGANVWMGAGERTASRALRWQRLSRLGWQGSICVILRLVCVEMNERLWGWGQAAGSLLRGKT